MEEFEFHVYPMKPVPGKPGYFQGESVVVRVVKGLPMDVVRAEAEKFLEPGERFWTRTENFFNRPLGRS